MNKNEISFEDFQGRILTFIEKAKTIYKVLEKNSEASLVELKPITGRKHQLRKQLYALGQPIFGDVKYKLSNSYKGINKNLNEKSLLRDIFVQVNISDEPTKGGVKVSEIDKFLDNGKITVKNRSSQPAPKVFAASSRVPGIALNATTIG